MALQAAVYVRISRDQVDPTTGEKKGLGVERQRQDCQALAKTRRWSVVDVFTDNDISAFSGKHRPRYEAMLEAIKAGEVDAVIAWHPDRLHRSPKELEPFIDLVESHGVTIATVQGGEYDLTTASGRMTARIVGAVARQESEHKSERIRRQREQAATTGAYHGGRRAFGYERDGMTIIEAEADLIREAATRVLAGESLPTIADDWNARGLRSPSGVRWRITTLRSMLAGPRLAGLRVHRGAIVGDAVWPAILDRETFERLRVVLGDPRRRQRGRPPVQLLSGLARCGRCGGKLHSSKRLDGSRRYVCNKKPGDDNCGRIAVKADPLEDLVVKAVHEVLKSPNVAKAASRRPPRSGPDNAATIAECEKRLDGLAEMYGDGVFDRREWLAARTKVTDRLTKARNALAREQGTQALTPLRGSDPAAAWEKLDLTRQRAVLAALIDRITISSANGRSIFAPDRVEIVWKA